MLLVTGATGFVGDTLTASLIKKGHRVRVLCRRKEDAGKFSSKAEVAFGDITKPETLKNALRGVDTVFHLAGLVSYSKPRGELFRINAKGTENLLAHCENVDRFIFSSSVSVYGEIKGKADENYPLSPRTHYGESKAEAERLILDSGVKSVILRIAPIYGRGSPSWNKNLGLLERGFPISNTKNTTHVVHISDVIQAFEGALKRGKGVYNIAGGAPVPFTDFAETIVRQLGKRPRRMPMFAVSLLARLTGMKTYLDVLIMNRHYVIDKARKELGYRPKADFKLEIKRMVEWYKEA